MYAPEIHVHPLDLDVGEVELVSTMLAPDERERASRFRFDVHRNRYIRGRAALRRVLGDHLASDPRQIEIRTLEFGKPVLDPKYRLAFNLAHSEHRGILAVGRDRELGIDIELLRPITDREALGEQHFSKSEQIAIRNATADQRDRLFLNCWTRKEAHLKMIGTGIARDLRHITVGVANTSVTTVETVLHTIELETGAIVTIASNRPWLQLHFHAVRSRQNPE